MKTVVDASVAGKWYFPEPGFDAADRLLDEAIAGERELLAPDLIEAELGNLLWKKVQRGECPEASAFEILSLWETDRPRAVAAPEIAPRALELAIRLGQTVYDCLYLAAAIDFEASLATADRVLARVARPFVADVIEVAG